MSLPNDVVGEISCIVVGAILATTLAIGLAVRHRRARERRVKEASTPR